MLLLAATFVTAWQGSTAAQSVFEKLVMPGELIEGHAKLEKDCGNCHEPFSKSAQPRLCLNCHKEVAADIAAQRGFHGKSSAVAKAECRHCHADHKGRNADIVNLDRTLFNHALTNFALKGAHRSVDCQSCHAPKAKLRAAANDCVGCHRKIDPHKGRLGDVCQSCHSEDGWRKVKAFDHSRTKFPLEHAHVRVPCATCHAGERYKGLPSQCADCHRLQDVHAGRRGDKCATCHSPRKWATVHFDHDKATRFALKGGHKKVKCESCHTGDLYKEKLSMRCASCHQKNDPHKGQLGAACERCHQETGWRQKVAFDHDLTQFPLIGRHTTVTCEECHRTPRFKDAPKQCSACHEDTFHKARLGPACATCHNPNGWTRWRFDHQAQTRFPLTGAHVGVGCHGCHRTPVTTKVGLAKDCYSCHMADDVHRGGFGRLCEKCHSTVSFRQGSIRR